jgi:hypothetical protein
MSSFGHLAQILSDLTFASEDSVAIIKLGVITSMMTAKTTTKQFFFS